MIKYVREKLEEYRNAYMEHLGIANANHGAMQAFQELLDRLLKEEAEKVTDTPDMPQANNVSNSWTAG